jgi:hypothetical protein
MRKSIEIQIYEVHLFLGGAVGSNSEKWSQKKRY